MSSIDIRPAVLAVVDEFINSLTDNEDLAATVHEQLDPALTSLNGIITELVESQV